MAKNWVYMAVASVQRDHKEHSLDTPANMACFLFYYPRNGLYSSLKHFSEIDSHSNPTFTGKGIEANKGKRFA